MGLQTWIMFIVYDQWIVISFLLRFPGHTAKSGKPASKYTGSFGITEFLIVQLSEKRIAACL